MNNKDYAGEKKPSMLRRRVGHDYKSRCIYMVTLTTEERRPLLGRLVGNPDASHGDADAPRVELSELGQSVKMCLKSIEAYHPEVRIFAFVIMPDHLHFILSVEKMCDVHLGDIIKGFKSGCNKEYRRLMGVTGQLQQCCKTDDKFADGKNSDSSVSGKQAEDNSEIHGLLWSRGYNDHILDGKGELDRWYKYIKDNPRRLAVKRSHPEYFRVRFDIAIAGQNYAAIGNCFLLDNPLKVQIQCSRKLTDAEIEDYKERMLGAARKGVVLVSPAISKGEKVVMRAALDAGYPLIFLSPWGFNSFSKPGHQYYDACAEGRFLILAPWEHQNQRITLTRDMCLQLNQMAKDICEYKSH